MYVERRFPRDPESKASARVAAGRTAAATR